MASQRKQKQKKSATFRDKFRKPMEWYIKKARELGCENSEVLKSLNKSGIVTAQHQKAINKISRLKTGNLHDPESENPNEKRNWRNRERKLTDDKKWLDARGIKLSS